MEPAVWAAIIAAFATLAVGILTNWDKIFLKKQSPQKTDNEKSSSNIQVVPASARAPNFATVPITTRIAMGQFTANVTSYNAGHLIHYSIQRGEDILLYCQVIELWRIDQEFIDFFLFILRQIKLEEYVAEMPPISRKSKEREFEFVVCSIPKMFSRPDRETYSKHFDLVTAPNGVAAFPNLGGDALLVVPSPCGEEADYRGMVSFLKTAPISQQRRLWQEVGQQMNARLSDHPIWLSVAGGGVAWLHLRLDNYPKYYRYQPFRHEFRSGKTTDDRTAGDSVGIG